MKDVRYGLRMLRRSPVFSAVAILTLALGIGAVTALFTVVNAVLLEPLPFDDSERLVLLWTENESEAQSRYFVSPQDFGDWRDMATTFEAMSGFWPTPLAVTQPDGTPVKVSGVYTTENFFEVVGAGTVLGRGFTQENGPGSQQVIALSEGFWRLRLGADPDIIGKTLIVDGDPLEVVGVIRQDQAFPEGTDIWLNMTWPMSIQSRYARWMSAVGKLAPGVPLERAAEDLDRVALRLAEQYPADVGWGTDVAYLRDFVVGDTGRALWILLGATGLILLIACANVANLLLSRADARGLEVAIRSAFGASRWRVARQLLVESLVLAGMGAGLGLAGAGVALKLIPTVAPGLLPWTSDPTVNPLVLAVTLGSTLLTGVLFGLAPVARLAYGGIFTPLREGTRGTRSVGGVRLQGLFVVAQLGLATVLVIGAGLLIRSFDSLRQVDTGFRAGGVLTFELDAGPAAAETDQDVSAFYDLTLAELAALPGVEGVGATSELPLSESLDYMLPFTVRDRVVPEGTEERAYLRQVSPGFFGTMETPLVQGRGLAPSDRLGEPGVALINRAMRDRYWPDSNPIGEVFTTTANRFGPLGAILVDEAEIVGIVEDIRYAGVREEPQPAIYFSTGQSAIRRMVITLRTSGAPQDLVASVRAKVNQLDATIPVSNVRTMNQIMDLALVRDRFSTLLLTVFGAVALALAAVGVYGVLAYSVEQRVGELGIRMALGASRGAVRAMVLKEGGALLAAGLGLGLVAALALGGVLATQLYEVDPRDPTVYGAVMAILAVVGVAASYLPARRATQVDPMVAIRGR